MKPKTPAAEAPDVIRINPPNMGNLEFEIIGTAPYMQCRFSADAIGAIRNKQSAGDTSSKKKVRAPKDFEAAYKGAIHVSREGWAGIPAPAFRNAMISACRICDIKMTRAKLTIFVHADGFDAVDGIPLVKIKGKPRVHQMHVRLPNGSCDIRVRPMWDDWGATVRVKFDADQFTGTDVANLFARAGMQVGIGEGRPDSPNSAGMGLGTFRLKGSSE
jgi:hypothetical protein